MADENAAGFRHEGEPAFPVDETASEETEGSSQEQDENQEGETQSDDGEADDGDDGDNSHQGKDVPFHEHPRWKQREEEWNTRFNQQEQRHQEELKQALEGIRKEFGEKREQNAQQTKIPAWFGGTQEQWDAYRADRDAELKAAGEDAVKRARESITQEQTASSKAVEEATNYMRSEISAIESDRTLNPTGAKIDAEKLLKIVLDNELIDTKGRWNYRAGWRMMQGTNKPAPKPNTEAKKKVAASTTSESKGEEKPKAYKTSSDFKKNRPW